MRKRMLMSMFILALTIAAVLYFVGYDREDANKNGIDFGNNLAEMNIGGNFYVTVSLQGPENRKALINFYVERKGKIGSFLLTPQNLNAGGELIAGEQKIRIKRLHLNPPEDSQPGSVELRCEFTDTSGTKKDFEGVIAKWG